MILRYLVKRFDYLIFDSYKISPQNQGIFRIIYALSVLIIFGIPNWQKLSGLPNSLFNPPFYSIANLFNGFPDAYILQILGLSLGCLYVLLLFGYKTKYTSILITILYIIGNSFEYSKGKIDHNDLLIVITPIIMAFSNWGDFYSLDSKRDTKTIQNPQYWPIVLLALVIGFAYFSAGIPKLFSGWLEIKSHMVKKLLFDYYYTYGYQKYLASYLIQIQNDIFWELFDYIAVIFEISFLIAVINPILFRFYIYISVCFHLINLLVLNIAFVENLAVYAIFLDYGLIKRIYPNLKLNLYKILNFKYLVLAIILQLVFYSELKVTPFKYINKLISFDHMNLILLIIAFIIANINLYLSTKNRFFS